MTKYMAQVSQQNRNPPREMIQQSYQQPVAREGCQNCKNAITDPTRHSWQTKRRSCAIGNFLVSPTGICNRYERIP